MPFEVRENHLFSGGFYHQDAPSYVGPSRIADDVTFTPPPPQEGSPQKAQLKLHHPFEAKGVIDFGGYSVESYTGIHAKSITGAFNLQAPRVTVEADISIDGVLRVTHVKAGGTITCDRLELNQGGTVEGTVIERHPRPPAGI